MATTIIHPYVFLIFEIFKQYNSNCYCPGHNQGEVIIIAIGCFTSCAYASLVEWLTDWLFGCLDKSSGGDCLPVTA